MLMGLGRIYSCWYSSTILIMCSIVLSIIVWIVVAGNNSFVTSPIMPVRLRLANLTFQVHLGEGQQYATKAFDAY